MKKVAIIAVAALALVFVGIPLFQFIQDRESAAETPTAAPVVFADVERRAVEQTRSYPGRLSADASVRVFPRSGGTVTTLHVSENDAVSAGELIMSLEDDTQRLQMEQAYAAWQAAQASLDKANTGARPEELENARATLAQSRRDLDLARSNFERQRSLYESGGLSTAAFEQAENRVAAAETQLENARRSLQLLETGARDEDLNAAQAQAESARKQYELARLRVDHAKIRAPVSGRIEQLLVDTGDTVGPQGPVAVVVNDELMTATITLPERDYGRLANRTQAVPARVRPIAYDDEAVITGDVTKVSRVIDPRSRTFTAEIAVKNTDDLLRSGMYVEVDLVLARRESALVVPSSAVVQRDNASVVFVGMTQGDAGLMAQSLPVTTGLRHGRFVEVTSGLQGDERIVVEGNAFIEAGQAIRPIAREGDT